MAHLLWLLALLVLPLQAQAQDEALPPPPLVPVKEEPSADFDRVPLTAPFKEPRYGTEPRLPLEVLGGLVGLAVGAAPGLLLLSIEGCGAENCDSEGTFFASLGTSFLGWFVFIAGMPLGMGAGIYGASRILDGEGPIGWVMGGVVGGALVGVVSSANWGEGELSATSSRIFTVSLALIGGIVAHEISHHLRVERRRKRHEAAVQVRPMVSLRGREVIGGLAGRF